VVKKPIKKTATATSVVKPVIKKPATATKKPVVKKLSKRLRATATKKPVVKKSVKKTVSGKNNHQT
jgi:hypothetical protein